MGRPPRVLPPAAASAPKPAADALLRAVAQAESPLVRLLLAAGVDYPRMAAELKPVFIEQARAELLRSGQRVTDSALSALSGVHRKDVRAWREKGETGGRARRASIGSQVFARWMQDPLYRDRRRRPRPLPRLGPEPSFETLARAVTQDVHPYTILAELLRLGLVELRGDSGAETVVPRSHDYVPPPGSAELVELFAANLADHAATAAANLLGAAPQLEQSVFADGLTPDSAGRLGELARSLWAAARNAMIAEAVRLHEADAGRDDADQRMRFGTYYWSGGREAEPAADAASAAPGEEDHGS